MIDSKNEFGKLLKKLIKNANFTQVEFYQKVGITKPYFYDIVSGKVKPPPSKLQFKMLEVLNLSKSETTLFLDYAAKGRDEIPADIKTILLNEPKLLKNIRNTYGRTEHD